MIWRLDGAIAAPRAAPATIPAVTPTRKVPGPWELLCIRFASF